MNTVTLRLVFDGNSGKKINMTFASADAGASDAQVKTLMQVIVANKEVFSEEPLAIVGAEFISRGVTAINVS